MCVHYILGAGENFNILEYTDPEIDSSAADHQDKSLGDQHQSASGATAAMQDLGSSASTVSTESSLVTSGSSMSSCASSAPMSATPALSETSAKPFTAGDTSAAKSSVASEEAVKSEAGRSTESCAKSVPTSGFMTTTDFQAKFLEFSQRKAAGIAVGQTAPIDDQEAAASANSMKVKKADIFSTPSTLKKSSPVAEESSDPVEMKPSDGHTASSESQPAVPSTSLPMQVDGCCDSSSDDDVEDSDVLSNLNMTVPYSNVYGVDTMQQHVELMNEDEQELVEIWQQSCVGLQVDGAADDDETEDAKDDQEQSISSSAGQTVTNNQLSDGPEAEPVAIATDAGVMTTTVAVETTTSTSGAVVSSGSASDATVASVSETVQPTEHRPLDVHLSDDTVLPSTNRNLNEDSVPVIAASQNVNVQESPVPPISEPQSSASKIWDVPGETTAAGHGLQSNTSNAPVTGEVSVVTVMATSAAAPALVSELQSSSAHGSVLLAASALQNPSFDGSVMPSAQTASQPLATTDASVPPVAGPGTVTQSGEMIAASLTLQSSSQCLEVAAAVTSEYSSVNATSQVVTQSYPVASSAIAGDAAAPAPGISSVITPSTTFAALPPGSHVDSAGNQASTNPAFNGAAFQLRPEMQQHAAMQQQQFMGHPPRRMYLPPEFHMQQHRMMQRGVPASEAGMMIPADHLPHGPPPPYPSKQFAGPQTLWVRQQHPSSGMPSEWIRHSGEFVGHRPMPPGSQHEWSRPQMMPAEWSGRQRMQQEWVYFSQQQPHHPSQAPPISG